jgi:hypothetical protein
MGRCVDGSEPNHLPLIEDPEFDRRGGGLVLDREDVGVFDVGSVLDDRPGPLDGDLVALCVNLLSKELNSRADGEGHGSLRSGWGFEVSLPSLPTL